MLVISSQRHNANCSIRNQGYGDLTSTECYPGLPHRDKRYTGRTGDRIDSAPCYSSTGSSLKDIYRRCKGQYTKDSRI